MVMADKPTENGVRSRVSTPIDYESPDSISGASDIEKESESEGKIKVGQDYQARVPDLLPSNQRKPEKCTERGLLMWAPSSKASDEMLERYLKKSKEKYNYTCEQALGMLFWHNYNFEKAMADLPNYTPHPEEWTVEDKVLFEQAFSFHGKNFHKIHQMLPDKSIHSLVTYYYSWKKSRSRASLMDKQARKLAAQREDGNYQISDQSSDSDDENKDSSETDNGGKSQCSNCGIACLITNNTQKGLMCNTCYNYFKKNGALRPTIGPIKGEKRDRPHSMTRKKSQLPKGMHVNHEDLMQCAKPDGGDTIIQTMEQEITGLKRHIQNNKQTISMLKRKSWLNVAPYRTSVEASVKINARWTNDELLLAVQGVRKYGKNFKSIAEVIGTKTEQHIRLFFTNYKRKYNLDSLIKEFEEENGPIQDADTKMEVDAPASTGSSVNSSGGNSSPVTTTAGSKQSSPAVSRH
ncbi:REST corepressor 3 [Amphibalanus amphitrite]|uniref:REST corepressor 3 n=1 Tax=Amphibalanus amphitrite TaxID=1232801 RepID=A0A6A4VKC0_AMPAM|nr:REST corepressor 3 [Amphibalanus amphitrite]